MDCRYKIFLLSAIAALDLGASALNLGIVDVPLPQVIEFVDFDSKQKQVIDLLAPVDQTVLSRLGDENEEPNKYMLYSRRNSDKPQELFFNKSESIKGSHYNSSRETIVLIHGWQNDQHCKFSEQMKNTYLKTKDANVIVVDWSEVASANYVTAAASVSGVGKKLAQFLEFLRDTAGSSYDKFHVIGFSLGAQVASYVGKAAQGKLGRVTGLDPAGPLFEATPRGLRKSDAKFVLVIHTNSHNLGNGDRCGKVDLYLNGGSNQPGCSMTDSSCSHHRSWQVLIAILTSNPLVGYKCNTEIDFMLDKCDGEKLRFDNWDSLKKGNGKYTAKTGDKPPYPQV